MSCIHRIRLNHQKSSLESIFHNGLFEPIIVEGGFDKRGIGYFDSIESLITQVKDSQDIVGLDGFAVSLPDALESIQTNGGYITGWEYLASLDNSELNIASYLDDAIGSFSFLPQLGTGGRMLQSVMKWVFISDRKSATSEWHFDPIGSAAWMVQLVGSKQWTIRMQDGTTLVGIIHPTDLLIVPPGLEHKVENLGLDTNIAITHNWVDIRNCTSTWKEVAKALKLSKEWHEQLGSTPLLFLEDKVDNLLFGLVMVLITSGVAVIDQYASFLPCSERTEMKQQLEFLSHFL